MRDAAYDAAVGLEEGILPPPFIGRQILNRRRTTLVLRRRYPGNGAADAFNVTLKNEVGQASLATPSPAVSYTRLPAKPTSAKTESKKKPLVLTSGILPICNKIYIVNQLD